MMPSRYRLPASGRRPGVGAGCCLLAVLLCAVGFCLPAAATAEAPPFEYRAPANGSQVAMPSSSTTGVVVEFACPAYQGYPGGHQTWSDYWVQFATSPELNPQGELATPFRIYLNSARPINAAEDVCQAELGSYYAHQPKTYYWQVERLGCFPPECTNKRGPVWSFNVVAPPPPPAPTTPPPSPPASAGGFTAYFACGLSQNARGATTCPRSGKLGAFLRSPAATTYALCLTFPGGRQQCARNQSAEAGTLYVNRVFGHRAGWYKAVWTTANGGRVVKHLKRT